MQVEHKTEKGIVLFVKVPELIRNVSVSLHPINPLGIWLFYKSGYNEKCGIPLSHGNWKLIGLTSEITEEQAKMVVDYINDFDEILGKYFKDYNGMQLGLHTALDSFKSLMQHLQVYEVNPYQKPMRGIGGGNLEANLEYHNALRKTGKWLVLFKPND